MHPSKYLPRFHSARRGVSSDPYVSSSQGAGASLFVASLFGFYLLIVQLFEALEFPFRLPVGDLGALWVQKQQSSASGYGENSANVGNENV